MQLITDLALAAAAGLFGQGLRALVGLKKQADDAASKGLPALSGFDAARFTLSLLLGAVAGVAAWLGLRFGVSAAAGDMSQNGVVLALVFAGYSGADFIEGFVSRNGASRAP